MKVGIYAGSVRPGGGLTILTQAVCALADAGFDVIVYTGASDSAKILRDVISRYPNVREKMFFSGIPAALRYFFSKFYFVYEAKREQLDLFLSINYYIPVTCRLVVYHINLLSFLASGADSLASKVKRFDARLACSRSNINLFESKFLFEAATDKLKGKVGNPEILYMGVDPEFYLPGNSGQVGERQLALVSSVQEHKDNATCLKALQELCRNNPEPPWTLVVAGGQNKEQWAGFLNEADQLGVRNNVRCLGPVNKQELRRVLSESVALISASRVESFCMVALEAMAAGCPAVVTNETSMPESLCDAGIMVNQGDHEGFANAVRSLSNMPEVRDEYIAKGRARAQKFTVSIFSQNLRDILLDTKA